MSLSRFFGDKEVVQSADIIEYRRVAGYAANVNERDVVPALIREDDEVV
jgi:hypothetical protein